MKKVILLEPVLAHYRKDVFEMLTHQHKFDFEIVAGKNYQGIKSIETNKNVLFTYLSCKILSHTFYYLKGSVKYILSRKPDIIISTGVDFHLIHTIILFFIHRIILRKRFYWWSHATIGNQGKIGYYLRKFVYSNSSGILTYNREGFSTMIEMGINDTKIKVVNNSLNIEDYGFINYDLSKKKHSNVLTILYSGRITPAKKVDFLIKAIGIIKTRNLFDFKCFIIGEGNLGEMVELSNQLGLENNIEFTGEKYGREVHTYFLQSDLFVYPGGIGLSIVHAMSFGIPVITTNNKSLHFPEFELLKSGFNGDLYEDNSIEDLANKIIEWEQKIRLSKDSYIRNCIQQIKDFEYLPESMFNNVINLLEKAASYEEN